MTLHNQICPTMLPNMTFFNNGFCVKFMTQKLVAIVDGTISALRFAISSNTLSQSDFLQFLTFSKTLGCGQSYSNYG